MRLPLPDGVLMAEHAVVPTSSSALTMRTNRRVIGTSGWRAKPAADNDSYFRSRMVDNRAGSLPSGA
jgi:hypothetical protein